MYELVDTLSELDDIAPLQTGDMASDPPEDLFLCTLGFEQRCLTLPWQLSEAGYRAHRSYYFKYPTNLDDNAVNLPKLERSLRIIAPKVESLGSDEPEFSNRFRKILDLVTSESIEKTPRITFDISVTANRLILQCIKVLLEYDLSVRLVYSEAEIYYPTKEEYKKDEARWQSGGLVGLEQGVSDVLPSIDYPGAALDPLPDLVVLFPSFNRERSMAVVSFVDPSLVTSSGNKVVWLLGDPHLEIDHWRLEAVKKINGIGESEPQHHVSTFDYKETLRTLEKLHMDTSEQHTITVSPLGSKMQALGTAIFCYMHPDVRIIFAMPKEYNAAHYSKGWKAVWKINFGPLEELRRKLDRVGKLHIDE